MSEFSQKIEKAAENVYQGVARIGRPLIGALGLVALTVTSAQAQEGPWTPIPTDQLPQYVKIFPKKYPGEIHTQNKLPPKKNPDGSIIEERLFFNSYAECGLTDLYDSQKQLIEPDHLVGTVIKNYSSFLTRADGSEVIETRALGTNYYDLYVEGAYNPCATP